MTKEKWDRALVTSLCAIKMYVEMSHDICIDNQRQIRDIIIMSIHNTRSAVYTELLRYQIDRDISYDKS